MDRKIVLASGSRERRRLMRSLMVDFDVAPAGIPEIRRPGEDIDSFVVRVAGEKCAHAAKSAPDAVIVAADTCVAEEDQWTKIIGKPEDRADAAQILLGLSGKNVCVRTALCVLDSRSLEKGACTKVVYAEMRLRDLDEAAVAGYLDLEPGALFAAAALVADGLAPAICERISEDEPGTLNGLPMISLCAMLREAGVELP